MLTARPEILHYKLTQSSHSVTATDKRLEKRWERVHTKQTKDRNTNMLKIKPIHRDTGRVVAKDWTPGFDLTSFPDL